MNIRQEIKPEYLQQVFYNFEHHKANERLLESRRNILIQSLIEDYNRLININYVDIDIDKCLDFLNFCTIAYDYLIKFTKCVDFNVLLVDAINSNDMTLLNKSFDHFIVIIKHMDDYDGICYLANEYKKLDL